MTTEDKIVEELDKMGQALGVISTVDENNKPEAASLYYVYDSALNIYFITRVGSRKYKNIEKNQNVAFTVTTEKPPRTVQLEGRASRVLNPREEDAYFTELVALASDHTVMPPVSQITNGEMAFMKISTTWVRLGDFEALKEGDKFIETNIL